MINTLGWTRCVAFPVFSEKARADGSSPALPSHVHVPFHQFNYATLSAMESAITSSNTRIIGRSSPARRSNAVQLWRAYNHLSNVSHVVVLSISGHQECWRVKPHNATATRLLLRCEKVAWFYDRVVDEGGTPMGPVTYHRSHRSPRQFSGISFEDTVSEPHRHTERY